MPALVLTFNAPSPVPALGYQVKYREVGTTTWFYVTPNPTSSPVVISGLPSGKFWEGTIASECATEIFSNEIVWSVDDRPTNGEMKNVDNATTLGTVTITIGDNTLPMMLGPNAWPYLVFGGDLFVNNEGAYDMTVELYKLGALVASMFVPAGGSWVLPNTDTYDLIRLN